MDTLQQLISRRINRGFAIGTALSLALLAASSALSIRQATRQAELLIIGQASSLANSAYLSQDLYLIQKEISRFAENLNQTQPYSARIEVRLDDRLIASTGDYPRFSLLSSRVTRVIPSSAGKSLAVTGFIDHFQTLMKSLWAAIAVLAAVAASFAMMRRVIFRSLLRLTSPLTELITEIETLSRSLSASTALAFRPPLATTREVTALSSAIGAFIDEIKDLEARLARTHAEAARFEIASQVAHDIRSPLAALDTILRDLGSLPEEQRLLLRSASTRINDIANSLLIENKDAGHRGRALALHGEQRSEELSAQMLSGLIDSLLTEKRLQYRSAMGIDIESASGATAYGLFACVQAGEFKRLLSNLVNNAVEAIDGRGRVAVALERSGSDALIRVSDNGKGIPAELLVNLGQRGATYGKTSGQGLGLHHAKFWAESWGGRMEIISAPEQGTSVQIHLPLAKPPSWFIPALEIPASGQVVVVDDDASIHYAWEQRLDAFARQRPRILHFSSPADLRRWFGGDEAREPTLFLIDYEFLGCDETGIDVIAALGIASASVLVSSRHEEAAVLSRCDSLGIQLLPKSLVGAIPIVAAPAAATVLIDDDPLVSLTWKRAAAQAGKPLRCYPSPSAFMKELESIDRSTAVYIDSNLGEGAKGEDLARLLSEHHGFTELYLATGYDRDRFKAMPWIRKVVGKDPPAGWLAR